MFWLFTAVSFIDTFGIIIQAPTLYDDRQPLDAAVNWRHERVITGSNDVTTTCVRVYCVDWKQPLLGFYEHTET